MKQLLLLLFLVTGIYAAGTDSLQLKALESKLDSLSRVLEKAQFEAGVTKEIYLKTNDSIHSLMSTILTLTGTIAAGVFAFMAVIAIVNYKATRHEMDAMATDIENRLNTKLISEKEAIQNLLSATRENISVLEGEARRFVNGKNVELNNEFLKIQNKALEGLEHSKDAVKYAWMGEAMAIIGLWPAAAYCLSLAGLSLVEIDPTEKKEEILKMAEAVILYLQKVRDKGQSFEPEHRRIVAEFSTKLGPLDDDVQKQYQDLINRIR